MLNIDDGIYHMHTNIVHRFKRGWKHITHRHICLPILRKRYFKSSQFILDFPNFSFCNDHQIYKFRKSERKMGFHLVFRINGNPFKLETTKEIKKISPYILEIEM